METKGNFNYFLNGESATKKQITEALSKESMSISISGLDVNYNSKKQQTQTEDYLGLAEEHQKSIGGRINMDHLIYGSPVEYFTYKSSVGSSLPLIKETVLARLNNVSEVKPLMDLVGNSSTSDIASKNLSPKAVEGKKHSEGKLFYELDFKFIQQMAERMQSNKVNTKYDMWNWKKPMAIDSLKQALLRHVLAVMEDDFEDDGREFGHLEAISNNVMMINYQLKNK